VHRVLRARTAGPDRRCRHWRPLFARFSDQAVRSSTVQVTATTTRQTVRGISIVTPKIRSAVACADISALPSFYLTRSIDGDSVALLCRPAAAAPAAPARQSIAAAPSRRLVGGFPRRRDAAVFLAIAGGRCQTRPSPQPHGQAIPPTHEPSWPRRSECIAHLGGLPFGVAALQPCPSGRRAAAAGGGFLGIGSKVSTPEQKVLDELASAFPD
jgi:hypothetical protein